MKYKQHQKNSPRSFLHLVFDLYGEEAARALGKHMSGAIEPSTVTQYVTQLKGADARAYEAEVARRGSPRNDD